MEARYLYNYAQSLELLDDDPLNNPESSVDGLNCSYMRITFSPFQMKKYLQLFENCRMQYVHELLWSSSLSVVWMLFV